ncbi:hypothetical protein LINPERHAP1_LOCUS9493 [Linum perenne]
MVHLHPWIPSRPSHRFLVSANSEVHVSDWILDNPRRWDIDTISSTCDPSLLDAIVCVPIGPSNMDDEWKWKFNQYGSFFVKSAYHTQHAHFDSCPQQFFSRIAQGFFSRQILNPLVLSFLICREVSHFSLWSKSLPLVEMCGKLAMGWSSRLRLLILRPQIKLLPRMFVIGNTWVKSFVNDSQEAAYVMVLSNIHREFCDRRSDTFFFSSPIVAEGQAILEAFQCATVLSSPVSILSDC